MSNIYVATIMDRHFLTDTMLVFSCDRAVVGTYDEELGVFIDKNGKYYNKMGTDSTLNGKNPYSFSNLMKLSELYEYFENNIPLKEAVNRYENIQKEYIHFIGMDANGDTYYTVITTEFLEQLSVITNQVVNGIDMEDIVDKKEESLEDELNDLVLEIINGKYNLEQLKNMRDHFGSNCETIESLIETISIQIESLEDKDDSTKEKQVPEVKTISKKESKKIVNKRDNTNKYIDIEDLFNKVTKTLIAQDEPTRRVITELARKELDDRKKREGILLTGPTGVGKTELMRLIAKYLNRPFYKINSTQLTTPGYVGKDIEEVLWDLYVECGRNVRKTEKAIVFFDEIDKKGSRKKDDPSGKGVLNVLLPFIEGSTYDACADMRTGREKVKIDTSNMVVILGGAYTDVYKNLVEKNIPGFNGVISSKPKYRQATTKDFVERGMMTDEFMGRVTVIKLNDLDVDDIKRVMLESDESAMKIQKEIFKKIGVKLTFTDGFATEVAKLAEEKKTGARGLNGIIDEATWKAFAEVHTHMGDYEEVILDEETVKDASNYQLVKKKTD